MSEDTSVYRSFSARRSQADLRLHHLYGHSRIMDVAVAVALMLFLVHGEVFFSWSLVGLVFVAVLANAVANVAPKTSCVVA